jgi:1-acyl-sn-glycerol-3-phosphate acyltransferase
VSLSASSGPTSRLLNTGKRLLREPGSQIVSLPPRWVRRVVICPLPVLFVWIYLAAVPLLLIAASLLSYLLPGKWRAVRTVGLVTVYLFIETVVVVVGFVLWITSGFGWKMKSPAFVTAHYGLLRWALNTLVSAGRRLFSLEIQVSGSDLPENGGDPSSSELPLVVMARHAGPADSILNLHEVMSWHGRRPRIVAKDLLQLDPAFDILLNRLPNRFISSHRTNSKTTGSSGPVEAISELATDLTDRDAFVIFPEGGNFTEKRRLRAIDRLREGGYEEAAQRATELRNVLPPRPAGTKAALTACPTADAVFVAHTGLDELASVGDLWFALPDNKTLYMKWYVVPSDRVPRSDEAQEELLFQAWESIDEWIDQQKDQVSRETLNQTATPTGEL